MKTLSPNSNTFSILHSVLIPGALTMVWANMFIKHKAHGEVGSSKKSKHLFIHLTNISAVPTTDQAHIGGGGGGWVRRFLFSQSFYGSTFCLIDEGRLAISLAHLTEHLCEQRRSKPKV